MEENTSKVFVGRNSAVLADPLLAPPEPAVPATSLFVINLCASIAPVQTAGKTIPGFETYKLYQVARSEDGRTRHRLRLGFFTSEADAERVLTAVRDNYPTAFVTCLSDDDRRFARGFLPDTQTTASWKRPVALVEKPAPAASGPVAVKPAPEPAKMAAVAPAPMNVTATKESPGPAREESAVIEVDWQPAAAPDAKAPAAPSKVAASGEDPAAIEVSWQPPALQPPKQGSVEATSVAQPQTLAPVFRTDTVIKAAPAPTSTHTEARTTAVTKPAARAPEARKPVAPVMEVPVALTLAKDPEPTRAAPPTAAPSAQPFHVGKGVDIPAVALSLEATGVRASPTAAAAKTPTGTEKKAVSAAKDPAAPAKASLPAPAGVTAVPATRTAPATSAMSDRRPPELDSTQTIRALTSAELNDDSQDKWFAIQLVVSERPVNLDAMPHLDIFEAYRIYSIANAGSGRIVYSLRLGFFREEVSAEAVTGYLRTFFPSPTVMRISAAEQGRFKDAPAPKATAAAASKTEGRVIELNPARDRKPTIPTVTMEVADRSPTGTFKPNATGSFKVNASGTHKALKPAAKSAAPATRRSPPLNRSSASGKHKALTKKSLQEQLLDEARDVQLSESAIRKLPKNDSLLSRLVGKLTK